MYHNLGIGKIVGFLIFISYFTILPRMLKYILLYLFNKFDGKIYAYLVVTIYVGSVFVINVGIFILYNSVMYVIYHLKHPFF